MQVHDLLSFEDWLMSEYAIDYDSFSSLSRIEKKSVKTAYDEYCKEASNGTDNLGGE